jgi:hypothetical protein
MAVNLASMVAQALIFKGIMSLLNIGTGGITGIFSSLFGASGGSFQDGKKVASFATGGSFIVPPGFPNDSFRLNVQSGERVDVTPAGYSHSNTDIMRGLNQVEKAVRAINMNQIASGGYEGQDLSVNVDGMVLAKINLSRQNDITGKGKNVSDFRTI